MTVLIFAAIATITRPFGVAAGWAVQVWILVAGLVVPLLLILGAVLRVCGSQRCTTGVGWTHPRPTRGGGCSSRAGHRGHWTAGFRTKGRT